MRNCAGNSATRSFIISSIAFRLTASTSTSCRRSERAERQFIRNCQDMVTLSVFYKNDQEVTEIYTLGLTWNV